MLWTVLCFGFRERVPSWEGLGFPGVCPPHPVLKTLLDAAFAKSVCKILSRWDLAERLLLEQLSLEVKILTTKDLRSLSANLGVYRLRLDYVELVWVERKVRCHTARGGIVDFRGAA
jgi:hypothetical protein